MLEMVVDRGHEEHALAGALVDRDLDDDADSASTTNSPPTIASTNSWWVATAIAPSAPPRARLPVSPMNTAAGGALNHRKARPGADDRQAQHGQIADAEDMRDAEVGRELGVADEVGDEQEREAAMITGMVARPSSPSVRFTALPKATITNAPNTM